MRTLAVPRLRSTTTSKLFVRQSSGLVRNVSVTNALFFNVAAFVGVGLTLYPIFYSLAFVPVWQVGPFSEYGWAAIIAGLFCILLALIFASLTSVMPRSGGDYVFSSRILHPFLGWLESWTLVIASVLIIAFEVPLVLRNLQITARIIGIGAGGHFFTHANSWFTDATDRSPACPGSSPRSIVLLAIGVVVRAPDAHVPPRRDRARRVRRRLLRRDVRVRPAVHAPAHSFNANLPHYTGGVTAAKIAASGKDGVPARHAATTSSADIFSTTVFPLMLSVLLFQFIGFQYSAYIAGEVRGNVRRGVLIALVGALVIGVLANSVYVDAISSHFGFNTQVSWGAQLLGLQREPVARCRSASRTRCRCWR